MERNRMAAAKQRSDYNEHLLERAAFHDDLIKTARCRPLRDLPTRDLLPATSKSASSSSLTRYSQLTPPPQAWQVRASTERSKAERSQRLDRTAKRRAAKLAKLTLSDSPTAGLAYR